MRNGNTTHKSDIYSLGVVIYEILTLSVIEEKADINLQKLDDPKYLPYKKLVEKCLNDVPSKRPSVDEILELFSKDSGVLHSLHAHCLREQLIRKQFLSCLSEKH